MFYVFTMAVVNKLQPSLLDSNSEGGNWPQEPASCWVSLNRFLMGRGGGGGLHTHVYESPPTHYPNNDSSLHLSSGGGPRTQQPYLNTAVWLRSFKDHGSVQSCWDMLFFTVNKTVMV